MLTLDCNIKDDTFKLILTDIHKTAKPTFSNKPLNLFHDSLTRNKNNNTNTNIKNVFFFFSHRQQTSETSLAGLEPDGCQALRMLEHEADMFVPVLRLSGRTSTKCNNVANSRTKKINLVKHNEEKVCFHDKPYLCGEHFRIIH